MNDQPSELLRPAEVATLFRVHPKTVLKWARDGRLKTVETLGGHTRFFRAEVVALMRELGIPGEPAP